MSKQILLVYAKSTLELINRKSALGSYIFCLCEILQKDEMQIFVNGVAFDELKQQTNLSKESTRSSTTTFTKYVPKLIKEVIKDLLVLKKIEKLNKHILNGKKYDCVLEFYNYASNIGFQLASKQNIPLIVVYDAPVLEEYEFFHGAKFIFKNRILKNELKTLLFAEHIVAYSNAVKDYLNKLTGKKLNVHIHQNVDFTRFDFLEKKFDKKAIKIGFIGSFLKWHRIDLLLDAFDRLRQSNDHIELLLIGSGMEFDSIKEKVEQSRNKQFITMTGFKDGEELLEIKKQLHIGVMPGSNWYGAPNKIFEYGAAKMAVVAPNTPTIIDLFENNKDILFFKQDDVGDLYQKLKMLCDDILLTEQLAKALQKKIKKNYSKKITSEFYNRILTDAMLINIIK